MNSAKSMKLLEVLESSNELSTTVRKLVTDFCIKKNLDAFHAIIDSNTLEETQIAEILSKRLNLDLYVRIDKEDIDPEALKLLPFKDAILYECLPSTFVSSHSKILKIILCDPTNELKLTELRKKLGMEIELGITTKTELIKLIHSVYPTNQQFGVCK